MTVCPHRQCNKSFKVKRPGVAGHTISNNSVWGEGKEVHAVHSLVDTSIGWLIGWLIDKFIDWLVDGWMDSMTECRKHDDAIDASGRGMEASMQWTRQRWVISNTVEEKQMSRTTDWNAYEYKNKMRWVVFSPMQLSHFESDNMIHMCLCVPTEWIYSFVPIQLQLITCAFAHCRLILPSSHPSMYPRIYHHAALYVLTASTSAISTTSCPILFIFSFTALNQ